MNEREFARLVLRMRTAQKSYFRNRKQIDLEDSKQLEREVDAAVREILTQPTLFDSRPPVDRLP
jgi:hypothetical protein